MPRKLTNLLLIIFVIICAPAFSQNPQPGTLGALIATSKNGFEGFEKNIGNNEFSYGSFRPDVTKSLITRSTDGKMAIEWETQALPASYDKNKAGFLWIAAIGIVSQPCLFDVLVNGEKRFEIRPSKQNNWEIKSADGGLLSFTTVEPDANKDLHGYMWLEAPTSWFKKGQPQTIQMVGHANENNSWIIVYQASDALSFLQHAEEYNTSLQVDVVSVRENVSLQVKTTAERMGTGITYVLSGKAKPIQLSISDGQAIGSISLPKSALHQSFIMKDEKGELLNITSLGNPQKTTKLLVDGILMVESNGTPTVHYKATRMYNPKLVKGISELSNSILAKGQIYLMNSSHQDIAWMDAPEKCVIERDTMLLSPLIEKASGDKNYRFDVEDALMLKEFIERHPDKKSLVKEMLADGRLSCGSTFIQPYEEMYSGESLARQFYFGAKWLKDQFNYKANIYWNEDVPGRTMQMAQLMAKAGTRYLMISRHQRGLFNWYSPDGSFVTAFSQGHYGDGYGPLQKQFSDAAPYLATSSLDWEKYFTAKTKLPVIPLLSDNDMSPARDYTAIIQSWKAIREIEDNKGQKKPVKLPSIRVATAPEFFETLMAQQPKLPSITGERPNVWLYIHGPSHQQAIKCSREADILLPMAEKFATANCLVDGSFRNYPAEAFNKAWEAKIYPDHGWGGKHGDITDAWFQYKYETAKAAAENILTKTLQELASKVNTVAAKGRPLVVFNSINMMRNDPVTTNISFAPGEAHNIEMIDANGNKITIQKSQTETYPDGSIKKTTISFIAKEVAPIGYATYYLRNANLVKESSTPPFKNQVENKYYRLTFGNGGLISIFDKKLNKELVDTMKFKAGEVFTMRSIGNGAGEFIDVQKPDMEGFDRTGAYPTAWHVEEDGPVYTTYLYRQKIRYAVIEQRIKLYHQQKQIDFIPSILNWEGVLYREFRMALPLNMTDGKVSYEVPFGVVQVGRDEIPGAAGERYTTPCKDIRPRGIENWISAENDDFGVTMSSSVAVADWADPTDQPIPNQMLQPILIASRKSCHWEGNDYLQTGNHHFKFSVTSHPTGEANNGFFGRRANEQLVAVWADTRAANAPLPESLSFFHTDLPDILISTVKKADDGDEVILRLAEMEGKDRNIQLVSFKNIGSAKNTNLIEEDLKPLASTQNKVNMPLGHFSIETIKIKTASIKQNE